MLGQRLRYWRSTETAGYKITPARNIVINIYEPEPAVSITQKYFIKFIDIIIYIPVYIYSSLGEQVLLCPLPLSS